MADFLVHHRGPDTIHEAESWIEAVALANALNATFAHWVTIRSTKSDTPSTVSWAVPYFAADYKQEHGLLKETT